MNSGANDQPGKLDQLVRAEQARILYAGIRVAVVSGPASAAVLMALFWSVVTRGRLLFVGAFIVTVLTPLSLWLYQAYVRGYRGPSDAQRWLKLQEVRFFFASLAYGSAGALWFTPDSLTYQLILFCFLFALSATLMQEVAHHRPLILLTFPPLLLPFIVRAGLATETTSRLVALLAGTGLLYTSATTLNLSKLIRQAFAHRFNNEILVEQLQAQKQLAEDALSAAEEANRAKSRFLAAASHDLRQPMHALGLFVSALKPHVAGEQGPRILERVESTVRSTEVMFNAMLDVSRLDAGVLVPDVKAFALGPLLSRLAAEYAPRAEAKGLRLRARVGAHSVVSDPTLIERVVRNYLGNAVRYTHRGGILLAARRRGTSISIELCDTGEGIHRDNLGEVYKEFFQLGNPERDRTKGLGLGLAIVKRVAQLLDHPIKLSSRVGRGSKFSIEVPVAVGAAERGAGKPLEQWDERLLVGARVLVIDDEADAREALEVLLRQWDCLALTADSARGALALARAQDTPVDAILADYRLRENQTGIEAIAVLQRDFGSIPAAIVTGDTAPDRLKQATSSGYALLHKPLDPMRLKAALCRLLGERRGGG